MSTEGWTQCEHVEDGERCGLVAYAGHTMCPEHAAFEGRVPSHVSQLGYTTDDDGVWLTCTCGDLAVNLGYYPTVAEATVAWMSHETAPAREQS